MSEKPTEWAAAKKTAAKKATKKPLKDTTSKQLAEQKPRKPRKPRAPKAETKPGAVKIELKDQHGVVHEIEVPEGATLSWWDKLKLTFGSWL